MIERPILFQGRLVRALLADRKTETRRCGPMAARWLRAEAGDILWVREAWAPMCRVRDPTCFCDGEERTKNHYIEYRADTENPRPGDWPPEKDPDAPRWRPAIHMPRTAARIFRVLVEKPWLEGIQEITEAGARAEGVKPLGAEEFGGILKQSATGEGFHGSEGMAFVTARLAFEDLWNSINRVRGFGWDTKTPVVVLRFKKVDNGR